MDKREVFRAFAGYTALSVLGTLGVSCYILADTFFVSNGLGTSGLAALNLAIPVYNLIHGTGLMLGMGGATRFSVCQSRGEQGEAERAYTVSLSLAVLLSALFAVGGWLFSEKLARLLGADADILPMTETYLRWLLLFAPAFMLCDVLLCFVRNDAEPRLSMAAMLAGSFANIGLDYLLIFPMRLGIFGAVFATGLSPLISMAVMIPHGLREGNTLHLAHTGGKLPGAGRIAALGFPSLLAQLSSGVVMVIFNAIILRLEGNVGVAAYGVIANLSLVVVAVYTGIAQGMQPLVSRYYGMERDGHARLTLRYAMAAMLLLSAGLYAAIFALAEPIAAVFNSENDAQMQRMAVAGLRLYFTSSAFVGYNILLAAYLTSIERVAPAHVLSLLRGFVLIVPLAFVLAVLGGMTGVWLAYPVAEAVVAALGCALYRRIRAASPGMADGKEGALDAGGGRSIVKKC